MPSPALRSHFGLSRSSCAWNPFMIHPRKCYMSVVPQQTFSFMNLSCDGVVSRVPRDGLALPSCLPFCLRSHCQSSMSCAGFRHLFFSSRAIYPKTASLRGHPILVKVLPDTDLSGGVILWRIPSATLRNVGVPRPLTDTNPPTIFRFVGVSPQSQVMSGL